MSTAGRPQHSLIILFSVIVIDLIGFGIVVPILPFYAVQYGASATVLGFLLTSYSLMQFICAPLWGKLSDRMGRKWVMLVTITGGCFALLLLGNAHALWMLFAGRLLSGFFAANIGVATAYVADVTSEEDRAKGMGLIGAGFGIGFILGPAIGGFFSRYGYHVPILVAAALNALNLFYAAFFLQEPPRHHPVESGIQPSLLSDRTLLKFCLLYFVFTVSVNQLETTFALFMMDRFAFDAIHVAYILTVMALVMVIIQGGMIRMLADRFGERRLLAFGVVLLGVAFFFVPKMPSVWVLLIPLLTSSVGRGLSQPALLSLVSKTAGSHRRGAVMGTFQAAASFGRVIGPVMAGFLYDHWQGGPFYFAGALMVAVLILAL